MLTVGSTFSGIGGLELGLEQTGGFETRWQVEVDEYCRRVLTKHWPNVPRHGDIRSIRRGSLAPVDVICGGFPCQDISYAGDGAGLAGERSGLWFEMLRVVRMVRPKYVVVENVAALLARGLDEVLLGLAKAGYDAEWRCVRASDAGAPHKRERVFIVAISQRHQRERRRISRNMAARRSHVAGEARERERSGDAARDPRTTLVGVAHERGDADKQRRQRPEDAHEGRAVDEPRRNRLADAHGGRFGEDESASPRREPDSPGSGAPLPGEATVGVGHADSNKQRLAEPRVLRGRAQRPPTHPLDGGGTESRDNGVGHSVVPRRERSLGPELLARGRTHASGRDPQLPEWPPSPDDLAEWSRVLGIDAGLEPAIRRVAHGISGPMDRTPTRKSLFVGRVDRLRALGNAVVPQVAQIIGRRVLQIEAEGWHE